MANVGSPLYMFLVVGALLATPLVFAGSSIEECSTPDAAIEDFETTSDSIEILESGEVVDLAVAIDISHTFQGDLTIDLTSPAESVVELHTQQGGGLDDILLTWTDDGVANGDDAYTCDCDMQPIGLLSDFDDEEISGDWTLSIYDNFGADQGTFNEWCMILDSIIRDFLRGDVDVDGEVSAITDALAILEWQFLQGPELLCLDAADVDDDGTIHAFIDVISLLSWQFLDGPEPPAPGVDECSGDPTPDELGCVEVPTCL